MSVDRKLQNVTFSKFHPKKSSFLPLTSNDQKHSMFLGNTFPTFQYSVEAGL